MEDESSLRGLVVRLLHINGYDVIEAANGVQAEQMWEMHRDRISLLFTDMVMPEEITGLDLAEKFRSQKPGLRVILSSGYSTDLLTQPDAQTAGITYLPKPYEPKTVLRIIRSLLDGRA